MRPSTINPQPSTSAEAYTQLDMLHALFRPLLDLREAAYLLNESERFVLDHIDDATFRAVDISLDHTAALDDPTFTTVDDDGEERISRYRARYRVYRYTIEHYNRLRLFGGTAGGTPRKKLTRPARMPVETIFPHTRPTLRRDEVAILLNCSRKHVGNLRLGPEPPASAATASIEFTPIIRRQALIDFLNRREVQP